MYKRKARKAAIKRFIHSVNKSSSSESTEDSDGCNAKGALSSQSLCSSIVPKPVPGVSLAQCTSLDKSKDTSIDDVLSTVSSTSNWSSTIGSDMTDSTSTSFLEGPEDLSVRLKDWAIQNNITHQGLGELLVILKDIDPSLPKDPRSLLKTQQEVAAKAVCPGEYYHFGLHKGLSFILESIFEQLPTSLKIIINVDGLPLSKSTTAGFWCIIGSIIGTLNSEFLIGIYYGQNKPRSSNELLYDTIEELKSGIEINIHGKQFSAHLSFVCCDMQARVFVKNTKSCCGFCGCDGCDIHGEYSENTVCFTKLGNNRSNASFRQRDQAEHHHGLSAFEELDYIDMIKCFPREVMHHFYKGITGKLTGYIRSGPLPYRLSSAGLRKLDAELLILRHHIPSDFARRCRSILHSQLWKATEFRLFILYIVPCLILKIDMHTEFSKLFLVLHVIGTIINSKELLSHYHAYAQELYNTFLELGTTMFGKKFCVYNVHALKHLIDDCKELGPVENFSAFKFENFLGRVKKSIRSSTLPLSQIVKRVSESGPLLGAKVKPESLQSTSVVCKCSQLIGRCEEAGEYGEHFATLQWKSSKLSLKHVRDRFFLSSTGEICEIKKITKKFTGEIILKCRVFSDIQDLFVFPLPSSHLGISKFSTNTVSFKSLDSSCICKKLVVFPIKRSMFAALPLCHYSN